MVDSFFFRNASGDSEGDGSKQDIYKKCAIWECRWVFTSVSEYVHFPPLTVNVKLQEQSTWTPPKCLQSNIIIDFAFIILEKPLCLVGIIWLKPMSKKRVQSQQEWLDANSKVVYGPVKCLRWSFFAIIVNGF